MEKVMARCIAVAFVAALAACGEKPPPAPVPEWVLASDTGGIVFFVHRPSLLKLQPEIIRAWVIGNLSEPQNNGDGAYLSSKSLITFDCAKQTYSTGQVGQYAGLDAKGEIIKVFPDSPSTPRVVEPDRPNYKLHEFVCNAGKSLPSPALPPAKP